MILFDKKSPFQRITVIKNDNGEMHMKSDPNSYYSHTIFDSKGNPATDYTFTMAALIPKRKAGKILVLGLGGGALVKILDNGKRQIDVVEIDPIVIEAAQLFGVHDNSSVSIFCDDGYSFVESAPNDYYDAIMVDAYGNDTSVGWSFSDDFVDLAKQKLVSDGVLLINRCKSVVPDPEVHPTEVVSVASDNEIFVIRKDTPQEAVALAEDEPKDESKDAPEDKPKLTPQEAKKQAIEHINSAKKSSDISKEDLDALTEKERADLVRSLHNKAVVERLVRSIEDGDILYDLSINIKDKEIVKVVDDRLFKVDPDELRTSSSPLKRLRAVRLENDLDNVAKFAMDDPDAGVRAAATRRLVDEDVLAQIAVEDENAYVSWIALSKIKDKKALERVALESKHDYSRQIALDKLNSDKAYERVLLDTRNKHTTNKIKRVLLDKASAKTIYTMLKDGILDADFFTEDKGDPPETISKILDKIDPKDLVSVFDTIKNDRIKIEFMEQLITNYDKIKDQKNKDKLVQIFTETRGMNKLDRKSIEKREKILESKDIVEKAA